MNKDKINIDRQILALNKSPLAMFSEEVLGFLDELSQHLMRKKSRNNFADVMAFAFWARRKNIENMKSFFDEYKERRGNGLCFHICPSNIPINFAFSFAFGLLAGNANIIRLPSKKFAQVQFLLEAIDEILNKYSRLKERNLFISYDRDSSLTSEISAIADVRMLWGGDATISSLKAMQTKPRCNDISFADRYSLCIIDANSILELDEIRLKGLSENFYNDTFLMDQNACSSPQLILWLDGKDTEKAKEIFWQSIEKTSEKYILQDMDAMDKYTQLCREIIELKIYKSSICHSNKIYRIELSALEKTLENLRGRNGYFYEYTLPSRESLVSELFPIITDKYQSISYFGIDAKELQKDIINNNIIGIDQIVPIGKTLEMDIFWDGYDILRMLSRKILLK